MILGMRGGMVSSSKVVCYAVTRCGTHISWLVYYLRFRGIHSVYHGQGAPWSSGNYAEIFSFMFL
jgi:hypothetical protein